MTVPISHQIPGPICPLYICPAPGITRLRTAATPGFQAFGIRLCCKTGSKNSPQCLHFFAAKATSSEQCGQRTLGSIVAVRLAGDDILHPSDHLLDLMNFGSAMYFSVLFDLFWSVDLTPLKCPRCRVRYRRYRGSMRISSTSTSWIRLLSLIMYQLNRSQEFPRRLLLSASLSRCRIFPLPTYTGVEPSYRM